MLEKSRARTIRGSEKIREWLSPVLGISVYTTVKKKTPSPLMRTTWNQVSCVYH